MKFLYYVTISNDTVMLPKLQRLHIFQAQIEAYLIENPQYFSIIIIRKPSIEPLNRRSLSTLVIIYIFVLGLMFLTSWIPRFLHLPILILMIILYFTTMHFTVRISDRDFESSRDKLLREGPYKWLGLFSKESKKILNSKTLFRPDTNFEFDLIVRNTLFIGMLVIKNKTENNLVNERKITELISKIKLTPAGNQDWVNFDINNEDQFITPVIIDAKLNVHPLLPINRFNYISDIKPGSKALFRIQFIKLSKLMRYITQKTGVAPSLTDYYFDHGYIYSNIEIYKTGHGSFVTPGNRFDKRR